MTIASNYQTSTEVLQTNLDPSIGLYQASVEVLRLNTLPGSYVSGINVEILRPNIILNNRPQVFICM